MNRRRSFWFHRPTLARLRAIGVSGSKRFFAALGGLLLVAALPAADRAPAASHPDPIVREGLAAEARLDTRKALELFLSVEKGRPNDAFLLQKIARQYSDLIVEIDDVAEKKTSAKRALAYAQRSVQLEPTNAENVLSLAVCHGKLAVYSDTKDKVNYSRLVREEAERALTLDPNYAWAHHVLGRWHYEVSDLGGASRMFVRVFYGGLPPGTRAEAIRHLERAVELEPDELAHHLELGFAYLADGQTAKARAAFEKGLTMPSRGKHDEPAKERARAALKSLDKK
jgi:tetratricopeptide (TPR) repeat protein